jgi:hypothetical protein
MVVQGYFSSGHWGIFEHVSSAASSLKDGAVTLWFKVYRFFRPVWKRIWAQI